MAQLIGYLSEGEQLQGRLSDPDRLVGELSMPAFLGGGLTDEVKQALLDLFAHLAYTDADGQDYYDALYNAFYPPAELTSISAVYTQSGSVFPDTPLDDLKDDLVVTARYSDGTTEEVTDYTLSGTLTAGTSTVTVSYGGKTTTFSVSVSAPATLESISAVYTQSGVVYPTDSLDSLKSDLVVTAHYSDSSTATVTTYTLSGSLTVGTSTITVTYSGKTTTFNVTVSAPVTLDSITAIYTQSGTVYDTDSLDSLKADLVVTAVYTDSSTEVVPSTDYTLSGTLTAGTSTITVSYEGKTTTFTVTVTASAATLSSISAVYTQSVAIYTSDGLGRLKPDLVVTAHWSDSTSSTVSANDYTLSGTLTAGTSTITVTYNNKTTTFNVTVTADSQTYLYNWDFMDSLVDMVNDTQAVLSAGNNHNAPVRSGSGVVFSEATQMVDFNISDFNFAGKTIEYEVASAEFAGNTSYHIRQLVLTNEKSSTGYGMSPLVWRSGTGWSAYGYQYSNLSTTGRKWATGCYTGLNGTTSAIINFMSGKNIKIKADSTGSSFTLYVDDVEISSLSVYLDARAPYVLFGGMPSYDQTKGDQCYDLVLTRFRIYANS